MEDEWEERVPGRDKLCMCQILCVFLDVCVCVCVCVGGGVRGGGR